MNPFDSTIVHFLNQFAFRSEFFDRAALAMTQLYMLRGVPMIALLWWIWFRDGDSATRQRDREIIITTIFAGLCALALGRFLAHWVPFRIRPFANRELGLHFPMSSEDRIRTWSAFPSDHAMLWVAVATGILLASWRAGIVALAYALFGICLTRVYVGLHHPTDVLGGAVIGASLCLLLNLTPCRQWIAAPVLYLSRRYQALFHMGMFLLSFGLATHFDELLMMSSALLKLA
ncbi:undecaprenyl-diphosphatase [Cupriavidus sp. YR651]|nr:undecaprenyl-diphosphatase [Cupriavidus sp. YR651]